MDDFYDKYSDDIRIIVKKEIGDIPLVLGFEFNDTPLDMVLVEKSKVILVDTRQNISNTYYANASAEELKLYENAFEIESKGEFITLRDVLLAVQQSEHFNRTDVRMDIGHMICKDITLDNDCLIDNVCLCLWFD